LFFSKLDISKEKFCEKRLIISTLIEIYLNVLISLMYYKNKKNGSQSELQIVPFITWNQGEREGTKYLKFLQQILGPNYLLF